MNKSLAQNKLVTRDTTISTEQCSSFIVGKIAYSPNEKKQINGIVVNEKNEPLSGVTIRLKKSDRGTVTDNYGKFSLKLDNSNAVTTIEVSYIGHESQTITIPRSQQFQKVVLKEASASYLDEVVVTSTNCTTKGLMSISTTSYTKKVTKRDTIAAAVNKLLNTQTFNIYPNPVTKSGNIKLSIKEIGNYEIQILNTQSKILQSQFNNTSFNNESINITMPQIVSSGMYFIRVINIDTKKQWVDKLLVQ